MYPRTMTSRSLDVSSPVTPSRALFDNDDSDSLQEQTPTPLLTPVSDGSPVFSYKHTVDDVDEIGNANEEEDKDSEFDSCETTPVIQTRVLEPLDDLKNSPLLFSSRLRRARKGSTPRGQLPDLPESQTTKTQIIQTQRLQRLQRLVRENEGTDVSKDKGTDVSKDKGTDVSKDKGTDVSKDKGTDVSKDEGTDVSGCIQG